MHCWVLLLSRWSKVAIIHKQRHNSLGRKKEYIPWTSYLWNYYKRCNMHRVTSLEFWIFKITDCQTITLFAINAYAVLAVCGLSVPKSIVSSVVRYLVLKHFITDLSNIELIIYKFTNCLETKVLPSSGRVDTKRIWVLRTFRQFFIIKFFNSFGSYT